MSTVHGPLLVVANPRSGDGRSTALATTVAVLEAEGVAHEVVRTEGPGHATALVRDGVDDGARFVVVVGGDGTLGEVVNGLVHPGSGAPRADDLVLGVVPGGSGSDFARTFGLDVDVERLVRRHVLTPTTMPIDLGRVRHRTADGTDEVRLFANIAQCGWGADVVATSDRLPRAVGGARYLAGVALRALRLAAVEATVAVDHTATTEAITNVVVANGQFFGSGLKVAPRALPDDGRLNVQTWRGGTAELLEQLPRARHGEHLASPHVREWQSTTVEVTAATPLRVEVDGTVVGTTPARFDVLDHALRLSI